MISKKASRSMLKLLNHKNKFDACLNDVINKNYKLSSRSAVNHGFWWIFGY